MNRFILSVLVLWVLGFAFFVQDMTRFPTSISGTYDAGIVLTGGDGRIQKGLDLWQQQKIKRLFISGVHKSVLKQDLIPEKSPHIFLGYHAKTTQGNAFESLLWLKKKKISKAVLITSHYHMRRSLMVFNKKSSGQVTFIPCAVVSPAFSKNPWWQDKNLCLMFFKEYHKTLFTYLATFLKPPRLVADL